MNFIIYSELLQKQILQTAVEDNAVKIQGVEVENELLLHQLEEMTEKEEWFKGEHKKVNILTCFLCNVVQSSFEDAILFQQLSD